tara:strand:+ start:140 stop:883 length:744 start_codon:yes stop_codon:yes gene_type:complete
MKVSKLIHDLHEKIESLEKEKIDLRKNQDQDDLNRRLSSARIGNVIHERTIEDLKMENESYKRENVELKSKLKESSEFNVGKVNTDTYTTTIYQENMNRLAYLEKHVAQHRYVFSEIPNTPENLKMVKLMKKHINKNRYNLRWRGQYLVDGENWKHYTDGQPLSKSKCIRVYIDSIANNVSSIEGFNSDEVDTIMDALNCWENELSVDHYKSDTVTQLLNYFESMRLHLDNSVTCQTKERVNIVTPN